MAFGFGWAVIEGWSDMPLAVSGPFLVASAVVLALALLRLAHRHESP